MIEKMGESDGRLLGVRAVGSITKEDYGVLTREVDAVVGREGSVRLLIDLEALEGEEPSAWTADLRFGREHRHETEKMAIVGDKRWQHLVAALADPLYAREAEYFHVAERERAWEWLRQD